MKGTSAKVNFLAHDHHFITCHLSLVTVIFCNELWFWCFLWSGCRNIWLECSCRCSVFHWKPTCGYKPHRQDWSVEFHDTALAGTVYVVWQLQTACHHRLTNHWQSGPINCCYHLSVPRKLTSDQFKFFDHLQPIRLEWKLRNHELSNENWPEVIIVGDDQIERKEESWTILGSPLN